MNYTQNKNNETFCNCCPARLELAGRLFRRLASSLLLGSFLTVVGDVNAQNYPQTIDPTPSSFTAVQLKSVGTGTVRSGSVNNTRAYNSFAPAQTVADAPSNHNTRVSQAASVTRSNGVVQTSIQIPQTEASVTYDRRGLGAQRAGAASDVRSQVAANKLGYESTTRYRSAAVSPQYAQNAAQPETLAEATRIALAESRSQRALALKNGASRSTVQAARSLKNPKITNTTSYVGMINQPTTVSDIDLSSTAAELSAAIPELAPIISQFPTNYQIDTPLCDKNFVTTVTAVTLPVYLGGRVDALTKAAEAMAQAAQAGEEVGEQTVKFQISEAYFLVLRTRQLRQVAIEAVETAESHFADSERMCNVGLLTRNVVLAAQVAASEARQAELKVANAQQLAEAAYNRLLWRPLDAPVYIADMELGPASGDLAALTAQAVQSRAELQALSAESRALQAQERVARADVLPQVALVGAYSYFENSHMSENSNATAAVGMTWTPVDGGTSRARQNAARQNAMAMARVRDEAESAIRLQVRQAWLAEQEARQRVEVASVAVQQAEENLRVVTRGFQEGTVNHTETLDAATMCTAAKSNYTNARYDAILAAQRLRFAVGTL